MNKNLLNKYLIKRLNKLSNKLQELRINHIYKNLEDKSRLNSFITESVYGFGSVKGIGIEKKIVNI